MNDLMEVVSFTGSVLMRDAAKATGLPLTTICRYIENGTWIEGKEWESDEDGQARLIVDGYHRWVRSGTKAAKQALVAAPRNDGPTSLYRHFDADGVLLYVGISLSAIGRLSDHRHTSAWFPRIAKVTVEQFPDRASAYKAETTAIQTEKPLHNISKAGASKERRATVNVSHLLTQEESPLLAQFRKMGVKPRLTHPDEAGA